MTQLLSADFASDLLRSVRSILPLAGTSYYVVDEHGRPFGHHLDGLPLDTLRDYRAHYCSCDPLHPSRHLNAGNDVVTLDQASTFPAAQAYIEGFLNARGYLDEVELFFRNSGGRIVSGIGLLREERDGRFRSEEIELLIKVKPVLELAVRAASGSVSAAWASFAASHDLTNREIEIIGQLRRGFSNREIAEHLGIRVATVKAHLFNAFKKTGTTSRTDLLSRLLEP